ncbi:MAG: DNA replication protein, partial [Rhodospirillaceae bacterium]
MTGARQLPLDFEHRPALGGEDFLVADCTRDAGAWVARWPDGPSPALVVHGPAACGKSHLAEVYRRRSGARALSQAELAADEARDPAAASGAWLVEDADDYLADGAPEPLFHLFNQVKEGGGRLMLTGRNAPARWAVTLADLRSRLNA